MNNSKSWTRTPKQTTRKLSLQIRSVRRAILRMERSSLRIQKAFEREVSLEAVKDEEMVAWAELDLEVS